MRIIFQNRDLQSSNSTASVKYYVSSYREAVEERFEKEESSPHAEWHLTVSQIFRQEAK